MMDELQALVLLVNQHQCQIRNLFQTETGWRANIGNGMDAAEFGDGPSMLTALENAVDKSVAKGFMTREKPFYIRDPKPVETVVAAADSNASPDPFADD